VERTRADDRDIQVNEARLRQTLERLAEIGATPGGGVTRLALSDEDRAARDLLAAWMADAGLAVRVDDVGNLYGHRPGTTPQAAPVLFGSHLDTVIRGGRFDGALGVAAALEVVRSLQDAGVRTARPLVVVNWTNEEGVRFQPGMLGSGVVAGRFDRAFADSRTDATGVTFGEALERIGYRGAAADRVSRFAAYLELHIEQGPRLEDAGAAIGAVEGIDGIVWSRYTLTGRAGHAGTTPMDRRRDALLAAAGRVVAAARLPEELGGNVRATVGALTVLPGAVNVIPGQVTFTLDLRAPDRETLEAAATAFHTGTEALTGRGYTVHHERLQFTEPTRFPPAMVERVEVAARRRGLGVLRLTSGAGHDAKYMADLEPTAMIFVPCRGGVSHAEDEFVSWGSAAQGAQVLLDLVLELAGAEGHQAGVGQ